MMLENSALPVENAIVPQPGLGVYFAPQPLVTVLDVKYLHLRMEDGTDLYLTEHGLPYTKCLFPENHWCDRQWRERHSIRLPGTSALYRMKTKEVDGRSKDIIVKWNRMGQDIPGETAAGDLTGAEFNSPFMEVSLVLEMRSVRNASAGRLYTHKPLAIYVPRKYVEGEQLGRKRYKMEAIQRSHEEIHLDWNRNYAVIYEWLKGIDAVEAYRVGLIDHAGMADLLETAGRRLQASGFRVRDNKPQHIIVRPTSNGGLVRDKSQAVLYGLVDFELLERTPVREEEIRAAKRRNYLVRQARRFETQEEFPLGLAPVTIMGVDYVYGEVESTGGSLWVVGRDPMLFDYFLPEKWRRTPRTKLSTSPLAYRTVTKDNVRLVWRVSRVGERPDADPYVRRERRILAHGYNSPFEEFSIAMQLSRKGIETKYPRAIYMTGHRSVASSSLADRSRYESHADLRTPGGHPILSEHHEYMTIWGYWNGPDDQLAVKDEVVYEGVDALLAYREGRLTQQAYLRVVQTTRRLLADADIEDLSLRGDHILLSVDRSHRLATDREGLPQVRLCNFELLRRMPAAGTG
ncbi:MAG TPA: hypothetical protein VMY42_08620, partial [Thermoguttaceae bacterium]|nr:hypothetical protein [Thermoguttaceae bacterium]